MSLCFCPWRLEKRLQRDRRKAIERKRQTQSEKRDLDGLNKILLVAFATIWMKIDHFIGCHNNTISSTEFKRDGCQGVYSWGTQLNVKHCEKCLHVGRPQGCWVIFHFPLISVIAHPRSWITNKILWFRIVGHFRKEQHSFFQVSILVYFILLDWCMHDR